MLHTYNKIWQAYRFYCFSMYHKSQCVTICPILGYFWHYILEIMDYNFHILKATIFIIYFRQFYSLNKIQYLKLKVKIIFVCD